MKKYKVDKFLMQDFLEYLIENYDIKSASKRWIIHGKNCTHSFINKETKEEVLVQEIAEKFGEENGFEVPNVFDSEYFNEQY